MRIPSLRLVAGGRKPGLAPGKDQLGLHGPSVTWRLALQHFLGLATLTHPALPCLPSFLPYSSLKVI